MVPTLFLVFEDAKLNSPLLLGMNWLKQANMTVEFNHAGSPILSATSSNSSGAVSSDTPTTVSPKIPTWLVETSKPVELWSSQSCISANTDRTFDFAAAPIQDTETELMSAVLDAIVFKEEDKPIKSLTTKEFRELLIKQPRLLQSADDENTQQLLALLSEFQDTFARSSADLAEAASFPPLVITGVDEATVPRHPRYNPHFSEIERVAIKDQVQEWLKYGIVEACEEPDYVCASNLLCVPKKNGKFRVCVDLRLLNACTRSDGTLMPNTDDVLQQLSGGSIFSTLDLASGYLQIPIEIASRRYLAFRTEAGVFRFCRLPFGLRNACAAFNKILRNAERQAGLKNPAYFDDITVRSTSFEEHLQALRQTFTFFRERKLKLNVEKCVFAAPSVKVLGHIVSSSGILPDSEKLAAIQSMPVPTTVKELQSVLGLANYYHRFIAGFATIVAPLTDLLRAGAWKGEESWDERAEASFQKLKTAFVSAPCLSLFNTEATAGSPLTIDTDASDVGLGAVLSQFTVDSTSGESILRPVAYASKKLTAAERNYSVTERELMAIVFATMKFRQYLVGRHVDVFTDHAALRFTLRAKDMHGRVARWLIHLSGFDLTIHHRAGVANGNADCLSRLPIDTPMELYGNKPWSAPPVFCVSVRSVISIPTAQPSFLAAVTTRSASRKLVTHDVPARPVTPHGDIDAGEGGLVFTAAQQPSPSEDVTVPSAASHPTSFVVATKWDRIMDPYLSQELLTSLKHRNAADTEEEAPVDQWFIMDDEDNVFFINPEAHPRSALRRFHVPLLELREEIILRAHLLGHFGATATVQRLQEEFGVWWPKMSNQTISLIKSCQICLEYRRAPVLQHPARAAQLLPGLFTTVSIDLVFGLPRSPLDAHREAQFCGIFVLLEATSKYAVAYPIRSKAASEIAPLLLKYISMFGAPAEILSDQGTEFLNETVQAMTRGLGIERRVSSPWHPRTNGSVERTNATLVAMLEKHARDNPLDWPLWLDYVLFAYRTKVHSATGFTPFAVMFGREHRSIARSCITESETSSTDHGTAAANEILQRAAEIRRLVEQTLPQVRESQLRAKLIQRAQQDRRVRSSSLRHQPIKAGTVVYIRVNNFIGRKFKPVFEGPFKIYRGAANSKSPSDFPNYLLRTPLGIILPRTYPLDQILPMDDEEAADRIWSQAVRGTNPSDIIYDANRLIDHRYGPAPQFVQEYLVSWRGFTVDFDTWEPRTNLISPLLLAEYWGLSGAPATARRSVPASSD